MRRDAVAGGGRTRVLGLGRLVGSTFLDLCLGVLGVRSGFTPRGLRMERSAMLDVQQNFKMWL